MTAPGPFARAVYLISGIPGSGKTTVAQLLAARFPRSAQLEGDLIGNLIVAGRLYPNQEPLEESRRQLALRRRNLCLLADSVFADGFVPIIDDVVATADVLELFRSSLRSRPLVFVVLAPRAAVVESRDAGREKHFFETWGHLDEVLRSSMAMVGLWLDSSEWTAEETVDAILARAADGVVA